MQIPIFISRGYKFVFKVTVYGHLIDELPNCEKCGGSGQLSSILSYPDDDLTCLECGGKGKIRWISPSIELEVIDYLQEKLNEYITNRNDMRRQKEKEFKNIAEGI